MLQTAAPSKAEVELTARSHNGVISSVSGPYVNFLVEPRESRALGSQFCSPPRDRYERCDPDVRLRHVHVRLGLVVQLLQGRESRGLKVLTHGVGDPAEISCWKACKLGVALHASEPCAVRSS